MPTRITLTLNAMQLYDMLWHGHWPVRSFLLPRLVEHDECCICRRRHSRHRQPFQSPGQSGSKWAAHTPSACLTAHGPCLRQVGRLPSMMLCITMQAFHLDMTC